RAGLPHRAASEGSQPRAGRRADARHRAAEHGTGAAIVQRLRRARWQQMGSFRHGAGAGTAGRSPGRTALKSREPGVEPGAFSTLHGVVFEILLRPPVVAAETGTPCNGTAALRRVEPEQPRAPIGDA